MGASSTAMSVDQSAAFDAFLRAATAHYGNRLCGLYLVGSRARGDADSSSDVDVVLLLADGAWSFWREKEAMNEFAYDALVNTELFIQSWPIAVSQWAGLAPTKLARTLATMKCDARQLSLAS